MSLLDDLTKIVEGGLLNPQDRPTVVITLEVPVHYLEVDKVEVTRSTEGYEAEGAAFSESSMVVEDLSGVTFYGFPVDEFSDDQTVINYVIEGHENV